MARKNSRITLRLTEAEEQEMTEAVKVRGYSSPCAFIRAAIQHELYDRADLSDAEQRIASSFDRLSRDVFRVGRGQQALFALLDTLTKTILTCVPEPTAEARRQAIARGKERYEVLMKTAGRAMVGDARAAMLDLVDYGAEE
jgi:Arc/MetJ-type ribon-helix-helix transcriptional regulator